jgi:phosphoglycolate phosphatase
MLNGKNNFIFDLDGTLINSSPEIINCFKEALKINNVIPKVQINRSIIGPPLDDVLDSLLNECDKNKIPQIVETYINLYDEDFCLRSQLYDGVYESLKKLSLEKKLFLITNKRSIPTKKILETTGIIDLFNSYYSIDKNEPDISNKSKLIGYVIDNLNLNLQESLYIGDTHGDAIASKQNKLDFVFANWGYGMYMSNSSSCIENIYDLIQ